MPSITVRSPYLRETGPVVRIWISASEPSGGSAVPPRSPERRSIEVMALIDTGSGRSIIQHDVAEELGLNAVGSVQIDTPSSTDMRVMEYWVRFSFDPASSVQVKVIEAPLQVRSVRALIGRDLLAGGRLVYNGRHGEFTLEL